MFQFGVACQNDRERPSTVPHHLYQPLQPQQGFGMQIMRVVNEQSDGALTLLDEIAQHPFALLRLGRYLEVLLRW